MTRDEAIKILDPETRRETMRKIPCFERIAADTEACNIAVAALRAQQPPMDRSRWWCAHCNDIAAKQSMIMHGENYCCNCGRPLTEEAWAELERRTIGNYAAAELHHES